MFRSSQPSAADHHPEIGCGAVPGGAFVLKRSVRSRSGGTATPEKDRAVRVLIVDDEPGIRRSLSRVMRARGFEVETADDGLQAVGVAPAFQPDCILMDVRMPRMNGIDAFHQLQRDCPNACVIFMTAYATSADNLELEALGATELLSKPVDLDRMSALIEQAADAVPVLIVDNDPGFCGSLARLLTAQGCDVEMSLTVAEAEALFIRRPRGVVILDVRLDEGSGIDLMRTFQERNPDILVILVTGCPDLHAELEGLANHDSTLCLTKPIDVTELLRSIGVTS